MIINDDNFFVSDYYLVSDKLKQMLIDAKMQASTLSIQSKYQWNTKYITKSWLPQLTKYPQSHNHIFIKIEIQC